MAEKRTMQNIVQCLACGSDLTSSLSERRNIKEPGIIDIWIGLKLDLSPSSDEISLKEKLMAGKMCKKCKKCYSAYARMVALYKKLLDNLKKIDVPCSTSSKHPR